MLSISNGFLLPTLPTSQLSHKVECQDCLGYAATSICAHAFAASVKKGNLDVYLKWLVANNKKSGGINYSKAITYGIPAGRGRKGGRPPRSRRDKQTISAVILRIATPRAAIIAARGVAIRGITALVACLFESNDPYGTAERPRPGIFHVRLACYSLPKNNVY